MADPVAEIKEERALATRDDFEGTFGTEAGLRCLRQLAYDSGWLTPVGLPEHGEQWDPYREAMRRGQEDFIKKILKYMHWSPAEIASFLFQTSAEMHHRRGKYELPTKSTHSPNDGYTS